MLIILARLPRLALSKSALLNAFDSFKILDGDAILDLDLASFFPHGLIEISA